MAKLSNLYSNFPSAPAPKKAAPAPVTDDQDNDDQQLASLESDPKAMQCINYLVQAGYSSQDVAEEMDQSSGGDQDQDDDDGSMDDDSQSSGQSAPLPIPGMR